MPSYESAPRYAHGSEDSLGVLLVNLGTPDEPTPGAVRRYLAEFLWDPRIVETPRWLWWLILHGVILRIRPARSARAYRKIWTDEGSPLLVLSRRLARKLHSELDRRLDGNVQVALGMSYGQPSIASALDELHAAGARRIVVLPLYPQYSGTTTGSVFDAVTRALSRRRWVPELRFVNHYHDQPDLIAALAGNVRSHWSTHGRGERLLFSFHGVPKQTLLDGDPYHCHCHKTARLVTEELGIRDDEWMVTFQSRVGREEWLRPYTDETVRALGDQGLASVDVVCPGFAVDCLETLEEIAMQNSELFVESGGGRLNYIPALNDSDAHAGALASLIERHAGGWPETSTLPALRTTVTGREDSRRRAIAMGAEQ